MMNITGYQCFNQNSKWLLLPISVLSHSRWVPIRPDKPLRVNIHLICSSVKESFIKTMIITMGMAANKWFNKNAKQLLLLLLLSHHLLLIHPSSPPINSINPPHVNKTPCKQLVSSDPNLRSKVTYPSYLDLSATQHRSLCWDFHCNRERYELVGIYLVWTGITIVMAVKTPGKQIPPGKDVIETSPRQWSELLPLALCDHLLVPFWPHLCDHPGSFLLVVLLTFHTYDIWHIWKIFMVTNCGKHKSDSVYLKVTLLSKSSS